MAKSVKIYTTPNCVYCKKTKDFFKSNSVVYQELDVFSDEKAREEMISKTGQLAVPIVEIEGKIIIGFDEPALRQSLNI